MTKSRTNWLRITTIILLVLLVFQFEFGMAVNLSNLPTLNPYNFTLFNIFIALQAAGTIAVIHASLGTFLTIFSILTLILSLLSRIRSIQIFGSLGFLSAAVAELNGVLFTLSGYQNNGYSHGMATNFILTFIFNFLVLYFLKS